MLRIGLKAQTLMSDLAKMPEKIDSQVSLAVRKGLVLMERHHKTQEIRRGGGKSAPVADKFTWRTGNLARSYRVYWNRGDLIGYYGSEAIYSGIIEKGGTIRPKTAKYLAIPLDAAKYGVGGATASPKDYSDLFFIESRKGNKLLVRRNGAEITPMFLLRKKVVIKARPTIERTEKAKIDEVNKMVADAAIQPWRPL